jgi:hypothetical protein
MVQGAGQGIIGSGSGPDFKGKPEVHGIADLDMNGGVVLGADEKNNP